MVGTLHSISEADLVALLREKDRVAFNYLYDSYAPSLYSFIREIIHEEQMAGDVLQQVFIESWKNIHTYEPSQYHFFTWLLNTARYYAIEKLKDFPEVENASQEEKALPLKRFKGVAGRLKKEHRTLIDLAYFQGYSIDEISAIEDIPVDKVKEELFQALLHFSAYLR